MKRRPLNKKYLEICLYAFCLVAAILVFKEVLNSLGDLLASVSGFLRALWQAFSALIWGAIVAYVFFPVTHWIERKIFRRIKRRGLRRGLAIAIVYTTIIAVLVWGIAFLIPQLILNLEELWKHIPGYVNTAGEFLDRNVLATDWWNSAEVQNWLETQTQTLIKSLENVIQTLVPGLVNDVIRTVSGLFRAFLVIMMSIFILMDRENLNAFGNRMILSFLSRARAARVLGFLKRADMVFPLPSGQAQQRVGAVPGGLYRHADPGGALQPAAEPDRGLYQPHPLHRSLDRRGAHPADYPFG